MASPVTSSPIQEDHQVIHDTADNNESCFMKTAGLVYSLVQVLNQLLWNAAGDFMHDSTYMFADQRVARLNESMKYSDEAISQTPFYLREFLAVPPDATMNDFDLDRVFFDAFSNVHPKLKKAILYVIWHSSGEPSVDPMTFGNDHMSSTPRSELVRDAIKYICSHAEDHREYLPHRVVRYTENAELDRIILEGIYNVTLQPVE